MNTTLAMLVYASLLYIGPGTVCSLAALLNGQPVDAAIIFALAVAAYVFALVLYVTLRTRTVSASYPEVPTR